MFSLCATNEAVALMPYRDSYESEFVSGYFYFIRKDPFWPQH
jgi:hypothetical protein